jgi:hypothetical protein
MNESLAVRAVRRTPVVAAALLVVALAGCADMAGIGSQAKLRDASSLGIARDSGNAAASLQASTANGGSPSAIRNSTR